MNIGKSLINTAGAIAAISIATGGIAFVEERIDEKRKQSVNVPMRKMGIYEHYIKRPLDCTLATGAIIVFSPVFLSTAFLVRKKLGSPVIFTQVRPGKDEKLFKLYKFRTMTDERDENGELLPDDVRLTKFGQSCRSSSIDELPELINIITGDMAIIGPRPQLVRDMVFMTREQRRRHSVRPGLSGLAQVNGRNSISWEDKLQYDLDYIDNGINFKTDSKLVLETIRRAKEQEGITDGENATAMDYGDVLLKENKISREQYQRGLREAKILLGEMK